MNENNKNTDRIVEDVWDDIWKRRKELGCRMTDEEKAKEYVKGIYRKLIEVAKKGETIKYGDIMNKFGGRGCFGPLAGAVSTIEYEYQKRPLLSSVVVGSNSGMSGDGFFSLTGVPENIRGNRPPSNKEERKRRRQFWENELERVYSVWQKDC